MRLAYDPTTDSLYIHLSDNPAADSDEVADGVADLGDGTRSGEVRGKVTKMTSGLVVEGSLDKAEVSRVVNAHIHEIQACYERELLNNAEISGRIVFDWTITETVSIRNSPLLTMERTSILVSTAIVPSAPPSASDSASSPASARCGRITA